MSDNETLADIVAEMREQADHATSGEMIIFRETWTSLADRIETAWKREKAELEASALEAGAMVERSRLKPATNAAATNAAAMREALVRVRGWLERMNKERLDAFAESQITPAYAVNKQAKTIIEDNEYHIGQIDAALSAPPRNCDVGTAEEQAMRYDSFCNAHRTYEKCCEGCPADGRGDCELVWAQMPYEEGGMQ